MIIDKIIKSGKNALLIKYSFYFPFLISIFFLPSEYNNNNKQIQSMPFISKGCSYYLTSQHQLQFLHYQALSGLGFNKLGFYEECIAQAQNQFYLAQGKTQIFGPMEDDTQRVFMSGICFNKVCSAEDLQYALGSLYQYMQLPFKLVKVQTPSLIEETFQFENITALTVMTILFLLFIICSIIDFLKKMKKINFDTTFVQIFSVFTTFKLLESRSQRNKQRVKTFSGIKVLSLVGILMTNIGMVASKAPTTSIYDSTQNGSIFLFFYGADIWLMVSGFFISYLLLKQYAKLRSTKILLLKILRRFSRFWPIYMLSILLNSTVLPLIGSGPLWPLLIEYPAERKCLSLPHIFMVSNFFDTDCYNWLWLIQLDFQLCFIFVPVLLLYIHWDKAICRYFFFIIQLIFLACSILVGLLLIQTQYQNITDYFLYKEYSQLNIWPLTRAVGFLIGYNMGIIFYNFKKSHQKEKFWLMVKLQKKFYRSLIPTVGILGFSAIVYCMSCYYASALETIDIFFFASLHFLVPLCLSFIFLPSLFGYWSPWKQLFECWVCHLLSKLSLSIYSAHYITTLFIVYYRQNDLELSSFTIIYMALCSLIPSIVISIVLTTIVEIPVFVCKKVFWKTETITYFQH